LTKAIILAAGRGLRMGPLTDYIPKPLLKVRDKPLISYHLEALARNNVEEVIINVCYHKKKLMDLLDTGQSYGLNIKFSEEEIMLGTAGGVKNALKLLGDAPFILVNADVYTNYPFDNLCSKLKSQAHIVLVKNPSHREHGDFSIDNGYLSQQAKETYTYSGIGIYDPSFFKDLAPGYFALGDLLRQKLSDRCVTVEHYTGIWWDVGTQERLTALQDYLLKFDA